MPASLTARRESLPTQADAFNRVPSEAPRYHTTSAVSSSKRSTTHELPGLAPTVSYDPITGALKRRWGSSKTETDPEKGPVDGTFKTAQSTGDSSRIRYQSRLSTITTTTTPHHSRPSLSSRIHPRGSRDRASDSRKSSHVSKRTPYSFSISRTFSPALPSSPRSVPNTKSKKSRLFLGLSRSVGHKEAHSRTSVSDSSSEKIEATPRTRRTRDQHAAGVHRGVDRADARSSVPGGEDHAISEEPLGNSIAELRALQQRELERAREVDLRLRGITELSTYESRENQEADHSSSMDVFAYPSPALTMVPLSWQPGAAPQGTMDDPEASFETPSVLDQEPIRVSEVPHSIPAFENIGLPTNIDLNQLPHDAEGPIDALVSAPSAARCFLIVAAEYKRMGWLQTAEKVALAGLKVWQHSDEPLSVKPLLLFLAALHRLIGKPKAEGEQNTHISLSSFYLRMFHELDDGAFPSISKPDTSSSTLELSLLLKSTDSQSERPTTVSVSPSTPAASPIPASGSTSILNPSPDSHVGDEPEGRVQELLAALRNVTALLSVERDAKRAAEDALRDAELLRRPLEDALESKKMQVVQLEDELRGLRTVRVPGL